VIDTVPLFTPQNEFVSDAFEHRRHSSARRQQRLLVGPAHAAQTDLRRDDRPARHHGARARIVTRRSRTDARRHAIGDVEQRAEGIAAVGCRREHRLVPRRTRPQRRELERQRDAPRRRCGLPSAAGGRIATSVSFANIRCRRQDPRGRAPGCDRSRRRAGPGGLRAGAARRRRSSRPARSARGRTGASSAQVGIARPLYQQPDVMRTWDHRCLS